MKVRSLLDYDLTETLFGHGTVSIKAGEVKEIPDAVAGCWMDVHRMHKACVEPVVDEPVAEEEPEEEKPEEEKPEEEKPEEEKPVTRKRR